MKAGVTDWNTWREANPTVSIDLSSASLGGMDPSDADLTSANLTNTSLTSANLTSAKLTSANLKGAYFNNAILNGVNSGRIKGVHIQPRRVTLPERRPSSERQLRA